MRLLLPLLCLTICGCAEPEPSDEELREELVEKGWIQPLPQGFPGDVPLYPHVTIRHITSRSAGYYVSQLTHHQYERVAEFHRWEFEKRNWKVLSSQESKNRGVTTLRVIAENAAWKCTCDVGPGRDAKGNERPCAITIYLDRKR